MSNLGNRTVIVLNHYARPRNAAGGTRHLELFSRLDGWNTRLIAGNSGMSGKVTNHDEEILETVPVIRNSTVPLIRILGWLSYAFAAFLRSITARSIDIVYASSPHLLSGVAGWMTARLRRVPLILEIRDVWPQILVEMGATRESSLSFRSLRAIERFLYRKADWIVYMAEGVRHHLIVEGADPNRLSFIPNGADAEDFSPSANRHCLRARYGFSGVVAVYAGAHGVANGLDLLLDAAKEVAIGFPDVVIVLVGNGTEKTRLIERAEAEGIANVRFMDPIPKSEIPDLLAAADIGLHCLADVELFRIGVSPNKLFDYMAAGLPVATNSPGVCGALVDASGCGLGVAPHEMALALAKLATVGDEQRQELGSAGRDYLADHQSRSMMVGRLNSLLVQLVSGPGHLEEGVDVDAR